MPEAESEVSRPIAAAPAGGVDADRAASEAPAAQTPSLQLADELAPDPLQALLARIGERPDFPALSESIRRVNQMAASDSERLDALSNTILQDFSLTNRILRLVNSSYYRGGSAEPISTMSRAIMVLGFETVRSIAVSLLLFEQMGDRERAAQLREAFLRASLSGSIARALSGGTARDAEEAYLAGMFHRLGSMLCLFYFPTELDEIERLQRDEHLDEFQAARRVLGVGLDGLGVAVAQSWGFAPGLISSIRASGADSGPRRPPTAEARLAQLATCSSRLSDLLDGRDPAAISAGVERVARQFASGLGVTATGLQATMKSAAVEVVDMARALGVNLREGGVGRELLSSAGAATPGTDGRVPDRDSPVDAQAGEADESGGTALDAAAGRRRQDLLTGGLVELSRSLAEQAPLNEVVRLAVETIYRALSLQRVVFSLRDPRSNALVGRIGFGAGLPALTQTFRVALDDHGCLFAATARRGADLLISDARASNVVTRIPRWQFECFGADSFMLLPVMLKGQPAALIYGDRPEANSIVIGEAELKLVRAIRNQVVLAFQQSRSH